MAGRAGHKLWALSFAWLALAGLVKFGLAFGKYDVKCKLKATCNLGCNYSSSSDKAITRHRSAMSSFTEKQRAYHLLKMRTRFNRLDLNHDGFISREDYELMAKKLQQYGKLNAEDAESTRKAFMTVADAFDLKPGVKIPVEEAAKKANREFSVMPREKKMTILKETHDPIFDALDRDKDGHISLDEFKVYFQIIAPDISEDEMKHSFNVMDSNKNGEISREEFITAAFDFLHGFVETEISKVFFGRLPS